LKDAVTGHQTEAETLGKVLADRLRDQGAQEILTEIFESVRA
jgi:hydroxymethylbilane synthase